MRPTAFAGAPRQLFPGYPFVLTRLSTGFYHVLLLPSDRNLSELIEMARLQHAMNQLPALLCLGRGATTSADPGADAFTLAQVPLDAFVFGGYLQPFEKFPRSAELRKRAQALEWVTGMSKASSVYLRGEVSEDGRDATPEERARLVGREPGGVPRGLGRCARCGEWRGECFDPNRTFRGKVTLVHCLCDNHNRCARCWGLLAARRLNGNSYDEAGGAIRYLPGFVALKHRCGVLPVE